jgi:Na+-translocating ferredoxin:NAD+ oxidoreductase RNF subunit RnfB
VTGAGGGAGNSSGEQRAKQSERNEAAGGHAWAGGGFDAAFVAVGAHIGKRAYIPAGDYDFCKGCGLCVAECPCGSIEMQPEP